MPKYCLTDAYLNYFPNAYISYPNISDCVITIFHIKFLEYVYVCTKQKCVESKEMFF